jgi:tRNA-modifying protein YgfZ
VNTEEYTKAHNAVGLYDATRHFGRVAAGGPDAIDLLHRMSTNDLLPLIGKYGSGSQTVLTTEKGRIIDHLIVLSRGDSALLVTSSGNEQRVIEWLDKFVIMEDAKFTKASDDFVQYLIFGPRALTVISELFGSEVPALENLHFTDRDLRGAKVQVQRWHRIVESGWAVYAPKEHAEAVLVALTGAVASAGGAVVSDETYNTIRIEAGLPEMPTELNEKHNPLETTLVQAVSWTKGCYIGQEVIARLDSYDKVQRHLMGITLGSDVKVNGNPLPVLTASGEVIGEVTSIAVSPTLGKTIGLAFIKSAYANPDATVNVEAGEATLVKLPFDL